MSSIRTQIGKRLGLAVPVEGERMDAYGGIEPTEERGTPRDVQELSQITVD
jgi:hypothetical protein